MTVSNLTPGTLFKVTTDTKIKINSNGSGVYESVAKTTDIYKIQKVNKKSLICSSINLNARGFSWKFKGFYIPINTQIQVLEITDEQIKKLNEHQTRGDVHPYTCNRMHSSCEVNQTPRDYSKDGVLIATIDGWICPCKKYTQPIVPSNM